MLDRVLNKLAVLLGAEPQPALESQYHPRKPLSKTVRNQLQVSHYKPRVVDCEHADADAADCCPICFCDYSEGQAIVTLVCKHYFHKECIWKWLKRDATCPMCKADLQLSSNSSCITSSSNNSTASTGSVVIPAAGAGGAVMIGAVASNAATAVAAPAAVVEPVAGAVQQSSLPTTAASHGQVVVLVQQSSTAE